MDVDSGFNSFAFMYVLPFKKNRPLVEYTIFSTKPLKKKRYKKKIYHYLEEKFGLTKEDYSSKEKSMVKFQWMIDLIRPCILPELSI